MSGHRLFPMPPESSQWSELLACPEFTLYLRPDGGREVIKSPRVEVAYWKAKFVISDASDKERSVEDRIRLAAAIRRLLLFTNYSVPQGDFDDGCHPPFLEDLGNTLGKLMIASVLKENTEDSIAECASIFRDALDDVAKSMGFRRGGKGNRRLRIVGLIDLAEAIFACDMRRPTKSRLRQELKSMELEPKGKNVKSDWRTLFDEAALDGLPEE